MKKRNHIIYHQITSYQTSNIRTKQKDEKPVIELLTNRNCNSFVAFSNTRNTLHSTSIGRPLSADVEPLPIVALNEPLAGV